MKCCTAPNTVTGNAEPVEVQQAAAFLTRSQLAVVDLVADGLSNKQIAYQLGIGEATVKRTLGKQQGD